MRLTRKELVFTIGLTTNFDVCMTNAMGAYECAHRHCAYMWACLLVLLFINSLLLLICLFICASYVCISLCLSFYLPSVHMSDIMSVCMSVCMYLRMNLSRDERTSVCTMGIEN